MGASSSVTVTTENQLISEASQCLDGARLFLSPASAAAASAAASRCNIPPNSITAAFQHVKCLQLVIIALLDHLHAAILNPICFDSHIHRQHY